MHEWASNQHGLWSFFGLWPSSFSVLALDHGPRHFMLQNRPKPAKTKFLQNICANVKMTNNTSGLGRLVILISNSCHYQGKQGIKRVLKERQQLVGWAGATEPPAHNKSMRT